MQKPSDPQTTLSKPAATLAAASDLADSQRDPRVTTDDLLAELRKISAWADLQRKLTKWLLIFLAILVPVVIGIFMLMDRDLKSNDDSTVPSHQPDWYEVDRNVRLGDFEKAIAMGEQLVLKTPQYFEAHERLAKAYLAGGNLDKAKEHFAEAFRLFPSEENEKLLNAIEKRIKADRP